MTATQIFGACLIALPFLVAYAIAGRDMGYARALIPFALTFAALALFVVGIRLVMP